MCVQVAELLGPRRFPRLCGNGRGAKRLISTTNEQRYVPGKGSTVGTGEMLHAQLHGKLSREQENLEDILTSNVFGTLSYLSAGDGIMRLLARCEGEVTAELRRCLEELSLSDTQAEFVFWPWLEAAGCKRCQPDVLIRLTGMGHIRVLVLIEAKYRSGKSSFAANLDDTASRPNDQLARVG